jgi:hypothetical protein
MMAGRRVIQRAANAPALELANPFVSRARRSRRLRALAKLVSTNGREACYRALSWPVIARPI